MWLRDGGGEPDRVHPLLLAALLAGPLVLGAPAAATPSSVWAPGPAPSSAWASGPTAPSSPGATSEVAPRGGWTWPLEPAPTVVRPFEPPPRPWASGHRGVDLAGHPGLAVLAAGPGVVAFSGVVAGRGVVTVRHPGGWRTTYEPVTARVPEGRAVRAGERIGRLAGGEDSHCAPQTCLHWGAVTGEADYHDPLLLLLGHEPVVLLPLLDRRPGD